MPLNWIDFVRMALFGDFSTWAIGFVFGAAAILLAVLVLRLTRRWPRLLRALLALVVVAVVVYGMAQAHYTWEQFQAWSDTPLGPALELQPAGVVECPGGICPGDQNPFAGGD